MSIQAAAGLGPTPSCDIWFARLDAIMESAWQCQGVISNNETTSLAREMMARSGT